MIRRYKPEDLQSIINLFKDTVHHVNNKDYTSEQIAVWAPTKIDEQSWQISLLKHYTVVVEQYGQIVGFADLQDDYIDRLYVHKDWQRQKIATQLLTHLEQYAKAHNQQKLTAHVSITAKPFFLKQGFQIICQQQVVRNNITLINYKMKKYL